ncbi:32299_t:CDS:2, partial [Racocetra persica]
MFSEFFLHLPNLHINIHLIVNAKNYETLVNTACGVKDRQDESVSDLNYYANSSLLKLLLSGWYITRSLDLIDDLES